MSSIISMTSTFSMPPAPLDARRPLQASAGEGVGLSSWEVHRPLDVILVILAF
jgi:hypothetical protein